MATPNKPALKQLQCPNCGAALSQFNPGAQTLVCPSCSSYVAVGMGDPEVTGRTRRLPKPPKPVEIGKTITIEDMGYIVLGRVVYQGWDDEDRWTWNEWMLGADDGRLLWLSYDETGFGLFTKKRFRSQFDAKSSRTLEMGEDKIFIKERYPAKIIGAEGELTWRASEDDRLYMAEGFSKGKKYSIQQTEEELEVYEGRSVKESDVARAFDDEDWLKQIESHNNRRATMSTVATLAVIFAVVSLLMAAVVSAQGESIEQTTIPLSRSGTSTALVNFNQPGRPAVVDMNLSSTLTENTYLDVDLNVVAPDGTVSYLFTTSFWHETGYDDEGFWRDHRTNGTGMFVPLETGDHKVQLTVDQNSTFNGDISATVTIRRNAWASQWLVVYGVVVGIIGVLVWFSTPARRK